MTAVETADGHCSARCQGQRHHEQIMWMMYTLNTVWQKERFTSVSLLLKTHSPGLIMRKTAAKLHRRGILQHTPHQHASELSRSSSTRKVSGRKTVSLFTPLLTPNRGVFLAKTFSKTADTNWIFYILIQLECFNSIQCLT